MPSRLIHSNSRRALAEDRPKLSLRAQMIVNHLMREGRQTDLEIAARFGQPKAWAQPRVSELIKAGVLVQVADKRCQVTGRRVRLVCAVARKGRL